MIRPKIRAIERERAAGKRDDRQVLDHRRLVPRIETRDPPVLVPLFSPAQHINRAVDKSMTADLGADLDFLENISLHVEFEDSMSVLYRLR